MWVKSFVKFSKFRHLSPTNFSLPGYETWRIHCMGKLISLRPVEIYWPSFSKSISVTSIFYIFWNGFNVTLMLNTPLDNWKWLVALWTCSYTLHFKQLIDKDEDVISQPFFSRAVFDLGINFTPYVKHYRERRGKRGVYTPLPSLYSKYGGRHLYDPSMPVIHLPHSAFREGVSGKNHVV